MKRPSPDLLDEILFKVAVLCALAVWILMEVTK